MKYFVGFTGILVLSYVLCFFLKEENIDFDWMEKKYTNIIKGISILTVLWAHTGAVLGVDGIQFIAGVGVALFLICSGYGLEISYQRNGLKDFKKKRFLKVCIPFWITELIGLAFMGQLTFENYISDALFITSTWFLQYIIICYVIFYVIKKCFCSCKVQKIEILILLGIFVLWFFIESICFANPDMPFLKARQMMSFPCGILIAKYRKKIEEKISINHNAMKIFMGGGLLGLLFMMITYLPSIRLLPNLILNILSLLTCFPLAISVLALGKEISWLFNNKLFKLIGIISYELFLIHTYTLSIVETTWFSILIFIVITSILALALHITTRKGIWYG